MVLTCEIWKGRSNEFNNLLQVFDSNERLATEAQNTKSAYNSRGGLE